MSNDYDSLSARTKYTKLIVGLLPPIATWYFTGSVWYAILVYVIGFALGTFISMQATKQAFQGAQRDLSGRIHPDEMSRAMAQSLPMFLWASPICGALAAVALIWLSKSN